MIFFLVKVIEAALLPSALLVECAVAGLLLRRWWLGRALLVLGVAGLAACLVLPVDSWALGPLEDRFPAIAAFPARVDGVIVLGGAIDELTSRDHGDPVLNEAANRITTFAILARHYPEAKLVFTGGSGALTAGSSEAEYARILLTGLGVAPDRVTYEDRSRTTVENAVFSRDLVHPAPGEVWALVTSASHMPRAMGVFRGAGWDVLPWPTGPKSRTGLFPLSRPFGAKLALLDAAAHEWVGLAGYWLTGRTGSLLPSSQAPTSSSGS